MSVRRHLAPLMLWAALSGVAQAGFTLNEVLDRSLPEVVLSAEPQPAALYPLPARSTVWVLPRAGQALDAQALKTIARSYGVTPAQLTVERAGSGVSPSAQPELVAVSLPPLPAERGPGRLPLAVSLYRVRPGDTLAAVAAEQRLSVPELLSANLERRSLDRLSVGETLYLPVGQPGLLTRIKAGESVEKLVAAYGADPAAVALSNGIGLPGELTAGDYLFLPGVLAEGFVQSLVTRRQQQAEAAQQAQVQAQYDRAVAQRQAREQARQKQQAAAQAQYERYLAWQASPGRRAQIEKYEAQARYELAQKALAQQLARQELSPQAHVTPAGSVRATSMSESGPGLTWPLRSYRITSRFGEEDIPFHQAVFHGGVDLAAPYGTPVYAARAGTVSESGSGAYGLNVYTDAGDALLIYGHLSRVAVSVGQAVVAGQLIGDVGCTGICTGPHLHFEVRLDGQPVDPLALLP